MCVHKHYRITNNHKTEAVLYIRQRTFSVSDNVRPRSQTLDRNSYLYIKHYFSVQLSVFTLYNREIKYTINVSYYYYLQGGVFTTLRNVKSTWLCSPLILHHLRLELMKMQKHLTRLRWTRVFQKLVRVRCVYARIKKTTIRSYPSPKYP